MPQSDTRVWPPVAGKAASNIRPNDNHQFLIVFFMNEPSSLSPEYRTQLLLVARESIEHGLQLDRPLRVQPEAYPTTLRKQRASFVTLHRHQELRGCIGHLEACLPLVVDVAENAFAAAFRDPRFPPLTSRELQDLEIHISVLTPAVPMCFTSEADLLRQLRPGLDGLILEDGHHRGTFLPSVWESLPEAEHFLSHLKLKAGLRPGYWSSSLKVKRYTTESFP